MAIAFVQAGMATASATSVTVNSGSTDPWSTPTTGNTILAIGTGTASVGTLSISGRSVQWNHTVGTDQTTSAWLWVSDGTETAVTLNDSANDNLVLILVELSGVGGSPIMVTDTNSGSSLCLETEASSTTTVGSGSFGVPYNDTAMFCALGTQALSGAISASPTGYTAAVALTTRRLQLVYKLGCSASTNEPATGTWTWGSSGNAHSLVFGVAATPTSTNAPRAMFHRRMMGAA